jgi:hypothetical protein
MFQKHNAVIMPRSATSDCDGVSANFTTALA